MDIPLLDDELVKAYWLDAPRTVPSASPTKNDALEKISSAFFEKNYNNLSFFVDIKDTIVIFKNKSGRMKLG